MASNFTNLLNKLSTEPATAERYKANPEEVMIEAKLTPAERTLLLSGDARLILAAFYNDPANKKAMGAAPAQPYQAAAFITIVTIVHP